MSNILKYQNPNSPLFNPHKIIENVPAREWGPRKINEDGTVTEGEGTKFSRALFQYWGNKGIGLQNEKLARDLVSDFTWMMIKNPNYIPILDKNYQSYDDAVNYLNHLEGLKKYLGLPYDTGLLMESKYKPTRLQGTNEKTYKFKSSTVPGYWDDVVEDMVTGEHNKNQYYDQSLNEFTAYRDRDEKGDFVSIYDEWDYNPAVRGGNKKLNKVIDSVTGGKPFIIYDRVYLDDYYDVPEEARGNPFITPAVVTAYKKGGRIHIKKKNRGKFTAAAKRAGMGVQEFARHVLANKDKYSPTLVKRANFARNSKKFKHENGGILKQNIMIPDIIKFFNGGGIPMFQNSGQLGSFYTTDWKRNNSYQTETSQDRGGGISQKDYGEILTDENGIPYRDVRTRRSSIFSENPVDVSFEREYDTNSKMYKKAVKRGWRNPGMFAADGQTYGYTPEQADSLTTHFNKLYGTPVVK